MMAVMTMTHEPKGKALMSKKRFYELQESLNNEYSPQDVSKILDMVCKTLNFDPTANTYTATQGEHTRAYRNKKKEEGISTYITSGRKAYVEKQKALKGNTN